MDTQKRTEEHFVKLPNDFRGNHHQEWISIALFRLCMVLDHEPNEQQTKALKENKLISTRIKLTSTDEVYLFKLMEKFKLSKLDTFLFVLSHISSHPAIYFEKSVTAA